MEVWRWSGQKIRLEQGVEMNWLRVANNERQKQLSPGKRKTALSGCHMKLLYLQLWRSKCEWARVSTHKTERSTWKLTPWCLKRWWRWNLLCSKHGLHANDTSWVSHVWKHLSSKNTQKKICPICTPAHLHFSQMSLHDWLSLILMQVISFFRGINVFHWLILLLLFGART